MAKSVIKIAFIDDEELLCQMAPFIFKQKNVELITFSSPFAAIQECNLNPPDVIFTDYLMPGINGNLLAKKMPKGIPIYLMTGDESQTQIDFPFVSILEKPYNLEMIKSIINSYLSEDDTDLRLRA